MNQRFPPPWPGTRVPHRTMALGRQFRVTLQPAILRPGGHGFPCSAMQRRRGAHVTFGTDVELMLTHNKLMLTVSTAIMALEQRSVAA